MTAKSDFTAEEWKQLLQAPGAAGMTIIMADPSFVIGSMKEAFAISSGILQKAKDHNSELLTALLADFQTMETAKQARLDFEKKDVASIKKTASDTLKGAVQILEQKATGEECEEIKRWLYDVSVKTANAAREGGFLGFGGTRVSEDETAALKEIAGHLGIVA
jgi:hypothetical protein